MIDELKNSRNEKISLITKKLKELDLADEECLDNFSSNVWFHSKLDNYSLKDIEKSFSEYEEFDREVSWKTLHFELILDENPKAAARPQVRMFGKTRPVVFDSTNNKEFKAQLRSLIKSELDEDFSIIEGEFLIEINLYRNFIKNASKKELLLSELGIIRPAKKPDADNYAKLVLDAFNGVLFLDDGQNTSLIVNKYFSVQPRIEIILQYKQYKFSKKQ